MRAATLSGGVLLAGALLSGCGADPGPTGVPSDAPARSSGTRKRSLVAPAIGVSPTAPSTVTVSVNRASFPIGINGYRPQFLRATITGSAAGANTPRTIPVGLTISYLR